MSAPTDRDLIDFVIREARLIDQHRFDEWLELFAEDGIYWMPLEWGQTDTRLTASLMHEDKLLLTVRVERLKGNRTFSQKPKSRCHHVLQTPQVDRRDEHRAVNGCDEVGVVVVPVHAAERACAVRDGVPLHGLVRLDPARAAELDERPARVVLSRQVEHLDAGDRQLDRARTRGTESREVVHQRSSTSSSVAWSNQRMFSWTTSSRRR